MEKKSYPFIINNREAGTLSVIDDGLRLRIEAVCDYEPGGIYRAYAVSDGVFIPVGVMVPSGSKMTASKTHTRSSLGRVVNITHGEAHPAHQSPEKIMSERAFIESGSVAEEELEAVSANEEAIDVIQETELESAVDIMSIGGAEAEQVMIEGEEPFDIIHGWVGENRPERLFYESGMRDAVKGMDALVKWQNGRITLALPYPEQSEFPLVPLFCLSKIEIINGKRYVVYLMGDTGTPYAPR